MTPRSNKIIFKRSALYFKAIVPGSHNLALRSPGKAVSERMSGFKKVCCLFRQGL